MKIAILSDIHGNREAYEAAIAAAEAAGAERFAVLGDIVGYGADPEWCVERTRALAEAGAIVVRGNHDDAIATSASGMNETARIALDWTRNMLPGPSRLFLSRLPLTATVGDILFVHAEGSQPERWNYVLETEDARAHFEANGGAGRFLRPCAQALSVRHAGCRQGDALRAGAAAIPLLARRRWLSVVGSVGQPRDGRPEAAFALYDTDSLDLAFLRAAYDVEAAAQKSWRPACRRGSPIASWRGGELMGTTATHRLTTGSVIDGFTIGELAHRGGMARLWHVTRPDIDFPIVMKVPMIGEGDDPAAIVSFEMEQMILPRLSGPHVPRFVANGDFSTQPYIVMERLPGASLYPMLERLPLPPDEVAALGASIATALSALHRQFVVHLDVKPSNVLFRETGEAVLIDYGLARHTQLPDLMDEEFRLPYGTAPYMAPEQVMGTRSDYRSDLFALGVLLYFFATGKRPFGDPQSLRGLKRRLWRDPLPPRALNAAVSPALQEVILRCLEVNPAARPPTAAQLALELKDLAAVPLTARATRLCATVSSRC